MKIHEYQGKEILRKFGVSVPDGILCSSIDEVVKAAKILNSPILVIKAQIHAGGRGKGGGIKIAKSMEQVKKYANQILGMQLITDQTGPQGKKVKQLLIEKGANIKKEFYISMLTDRLSQRVVLVVSSEGGMDIEKIAEKNSQLIHQIIIDPTTGLTDIDISNVINKIGIPFAAAADMKKQLQNLYRAYWETDASLIEINPLILTNNDKIVALDTKFSFDSNALFRHPEIISYRDLDEEDHAEIEASKFDLAYIALDGNIGCLVNGAGLAMATMDTIKLFGGEPANFLDVGGGATTEKVTKAFEIMLKNLKLKAILVNIFGGIMHCDVIAAGIISAFKTMCVKIPLVVRMKGTNEKIGKELLINAKLSIISADTMEEAAKKVIAIAKV